MKKKLISTNMKSLVDTIFFILQITFGYLAMLMAMTYSTIMFVSVVAGLTTGHVLFASNVPVGEHADACCSFMENEVQNNEISEPLLNESECCNIKNSA